MKTLSPTTALRHVYHAVYLQMLLGGTAILIPVLTHRPEILPGVYSRDMGGMLIFMGLNVYSYLRRYEKALAASVSHAPDIA